MKAMKLSVFAMAAMLAIFGISSTSHALHDGGVARCEACHTMHNSQGNAGMTVIAGHEPGGRLTKGSDPSSTCLNCHQGGGNGYHVFSTDGSNLTPGGDFYWLTKTFSWVSRGTTQYSTGESHGHSVVAADFGLAADATLTTAPGGTYNAGSLGCTSCHDPHGNKNGAGAIEGSGSYGVAGPTRGNFRLLGDIGYQAGSSVTFTSQVPVARSFSSNAETNANHADYGQGMSEWCRNCHGNFSGSLRHPAGNDAHLSNDSIADHYNAYVASGNLTGTQATAYLALVPFERGTADATTLSTTSTVGPNGTSNVMCLTCHRAHASAFPDAGRWYFTATFLSTQSHPLATDTGVTGNDVLNSYYNRDMTATFGAYQRSLCNKCHLQD